MIPVVYIIDASVDVTGALVAARREAELLKGSAEVVLVLPRESRVPESQLREFSQVLKLPMPQLRKNVASLVTYIPALFSTSQRLLRSMRERGCERVQINDFYLIHGAVLRLFGFHGRVVTWVRIDPRRYNVLGKWWLWLAKRSSDEIVVVSRFIRSRLPRSINCKVVYESREAEKATRKSRRSHRRLVYVSNYIPGKGQDAAIAAFERIAPSFGDARLCFVGGDMGRAANRTYRTYLQRQAAASAAARQIEFRDRTEDLSDVYRESYAALNFSTSESFSLTCQDASAFGLPVVASRSGGPEEIIDDGETGFLVPVGDIEAMAERMRILLADPQLASEMGVRGMELVRKRFAPDPIRRELLRALALD